MENDPDFNSVRTDSATYAPFIVHDALRTEWRDVRLEFSDWDWMQACYGECVDDFYLNGPGVEGLIKAARHAAGLAVDSESIHYNSEGDACYIHFVSMEEAVETAKLAASMISSREQMIATIAVARQNGWEDG